MTKSLSISVFWVSLTTGLFSAILKISPDSTSRLTSEVEANYSATHLYIDEVAGDSIPVTIFFDPQASGIAACEIFTNLNRRNRAQLDANTDGFEDGILPVDGNSIVAGNDIHYFQALPMTLVNGGYRLTLQANRTGAYRLTARYRFEGEAPGVWHYYNDDVVNGIPKRDHCFIVSPKKAKAMILYEVNPLTIISEGTLPSQRGTFADLAAGLGPGRAPRFSMEYVKSLGANTLWFQPIHPNGISGRQSDPLTGQPFEVGSPYAVKNFFEVMPLMAKSFVPGGSPASNDTPAGRVQAMGEFQSFCAAADNAAVDVMLDAPFNHTSYDTELGTLGQSLFGNGSSSANSEIRYVEARFFSRANAYDQRASGGFNIGLAPDRTDFGKFEDTFDVYYGRYAALVSGSTGGFKNEGDWFDTSVGSESFAGSGNGHFDAITRNVWKYFAEYTLFWLTKTGYPANSSGLSLDSNVGIDSLRADFGQGLPPQCWEYIINKTRTRKWNFTFMAESLDGGEVTYRSSRHFDILNENIVFPLHSAQTTVDFRNIYESRRNAYGQALVLLNTSSHDEDHYQDPWQALIRHAVNNSIDGVPLIFPGQELGLSGAVVPPGDTQPNITPFGYDRFETNFGKPIPHFKKYNSLMPLWLKTTPGDPNYNYGLAQLSRVFEGIGQARRFSNALRSSNRFFLNLKNNAVDSRIFSVAKFENRNLPPNLSETVFAFVNLDRNGTPGTSGSNRFDLSVDADGNGINDFGIKSGRLYNVKNIGAYLGVHSDRRDRFLIPNGVQGSELLAQGLFISLNKVPTDDPSWATAPYEPQYLKLHDVTLPPAPGQPVFSNVSFGTILGPVANLTWQSAADPEGGISGYRLHIGTAPDTSDLLNEIVPEADRTQAVSFGSVIYAKVAQINNAGVEGPFSSATPSIRVLDPTKDDDGDSQTNGAEQTAGTNPLLASSVLRISVIRLTDSNLELDVSTVVGKSYQLESSIDLAAGNWGALGSAVIAGNTTTNISTLVNPSEPRRFFRLRVISGNN